MKVIAYKILLLLPALFGYCKMEAQQVNTYFSLRAQSGIFAIKNNDLNEYINSYNANTSAFLRPYFENMQPFSKALSSYGFAVNACNTVEVPEKNWGYYHSSELSYMVGKKTNTADGLIGYNLKLRMRDWCFSQGLGAHFKKEIFLGGRITGQFRKVNLYSYYRLVDGEIIMGDAYPYCGNFHNTFFDLKLGPEIEFRLMRFLSLGIHPLFAVPFGNNKSRALNDVYSGNQKLGRVFPTDLTGNNYIRLSTFNRNSISISLGIVLGVGKNANKKEEQINKEENAEEQEIREGENKKKETQP